MTMISGIYGMNIPLPIQEEQRAFPFLMITMFALAIVILVVFKKKKRF